MKHDKIFPASVLNQSELFLYDIGKTSSMLYIFIIVFLVITFTSLFFIEVDISVKASGIIKPKGDKNIISSPIAGRIQFKNLEENRSVQKGDTLFIIRADLITISQKSLETRKVELEMMIKDLKSLTTGTGTHNWNPQTPIYTQELLFFKSQISDLQGKADIASLLYKRNKVLFAEQVIPQAEFEQIEFEYRNAKTAVTSLVAQQNGKWEATRKQYQVELREIETKLDQIVIQANDAIVIAPINGGVQKIINTHDGAYIHETQQIAEISPEGDLFAECHVSPKDIGLLRPGTKGKLQIDAFNYNDWGMLLGEVVEIFNDIEVDPNNNIYYYKIYCRLNSRELRLKNGYTGHIKKGMTANVQFIVTRRTLFQLLYDTIDNWLNPNLTLK